MTGLVGAKLWFKPQELADLALPGLPKTKRKINELAQEQRWAVRVDQAGNPLARPSAGRGGGLEYHQSLLPPAALTELVRRGLGQASPLPANDLVPKDQLWAWFDAQPTPVKIEAARRLEAVAAVEQLVDGGLTRTAAVAQIAASFAVSTATLWSWLGLIQGVPASDRLPRLAPQRKGGGVEAEIDPQAWLVFKSDYLRPERPTYAACYERLKAYAAVRGLALPHVKTLQRKLEREVDPRVIVAKRDGAEALRRMLPAQKRTVQELHALELVNIDGHKWDVFVRWPDGHIGRPMMVAIQDVYSRKFLAWRIGQTENVLLTRLAFADLFRDWGIPDGCLLDNGRAFASKEITGGAKTRFRFTIQPNDPMGLLTSLGVKIHWATPYRGQSKPIERGFRDLCEAGAKHPAFAGAYTGNRPDAKPENYGEKAVPLDTFLHVVGQVMAAHNAKLGRRTETARGGSFDHAFAESYARSPITRATPEQQRMALMAGERLFCNRRTGEISICENRYWAEELQAVAGQHVMVRFDPDNLHSDIHVYTMDQRFVCSAPVIEATGFQDVAAAKERKKLEGQHRQATRRAAELADLMSAQDLAALLPDDPEEAAAPASPPVIRPARLRGSAALALKADPLNAESFAEPSHRPAKASVIDIFANAQERLAGK